VAWLFDPVDWPGDALARLLAPHPTLDTALYILASLIGGIVLCFFISLVARQLGKLPSQPR
jgi:hypothetical protein